MWNFGEVYARHRFIEGQNMAVEYHLLGGHDEERTT